MGWQVDLLTPSSRSATWWRTMIFYETNLILNFLFQRANATTQVCLQNPVCCMTWNAMHFRQGVSLFMHIWGSCIPPQGSPARIIPGAAHTPQMAMFSGSMSSVRVSVEWLFGDIVNYFKFLDFKKNLKIGLSNIGKTYVVCALMRNALTCFYGNSKFLN